LTLWASRPKLAKSLNNFHRVTNIPSPNGSGGQLCYVPALRPENEAARQEELLRLNILDTPAEERFDRIVRLTRRLFDVPISYVSLVDENRQWFKSRIGIEIQSSPRDISFCGHAILQDQALIVPDARKDLRFASNPLVIGDPFVRFYAGQPLRGPGGHKVGTLCIVDQKPRIFSQHECELLRELTALVERELELRDVIESQNEAIMAKDALAESQAVLAKTVDELQTSKKQAEDMLHNILPVEVAQELRTNGHVKPMRYEPDFVLFSDFVGFTKVAEKMEAAELVEELNECFCHFDWVMGKYGVEKLKTIGDGYLAVAGIPRSNADDAMHALQAAVEMRDYMAKRKAEREKNGQQFWDIRIGLHVGPLIAGVVGVRKLAYDVWGDTVNTASRIESAGEPGRINVSADFHCWISDHVVSESRGLIDCKGKGQIEMFYINSLK
jgi:adenylate cyclase